MYCINKTEELMKEGLPLLHVKPLTRAFTLVELIIVVIIVGILASLGLTQYNLMVEKSRTVEAKVRIGTMRNLAYTYYLENGTLTGMQYTDVEANWVCSSSDFYRYKVWINSANSVRLDAWRCTSGGKSPNASREYNYYMWFYPGIGGSNWHCYYTDDTTPCFGLPG
jgi:prepilin-type N-terminal cleavage/methylation domain-containing protein